MRKAEEEELARPSQEHKHQSNGTFPRPAERQPLRGVAHTWQEAGTTPATGIWVVGDLAPPKITASEEPSVGVSLNP